MFDRRFRRFVIPLLLVLFLAIAAPFTSAQEKNATPIAKKIQPSSVVLAGEPLFEIKAKIGSFSAVDRAQAISARLTTFAEDLSIPIDSLQVKNEKDETIILVGEQPILALVDADAKFANRNRQELTTEYLNKIKASVQEYRQSRSLESILYSVLYAFLATLAFLIAFRISGIILARIIRYVDTWEGTRIPSLRIQNIELLPATQIIALIDRALRFLRLVLFVGLFYIYVLIVLSLFPWTKQIGESLSGYLLKTLGDGFQALFAYLPSLFVIALTIAITYYILKFSQFIFREIGRGSFSFPGFYTEWAKPTSKLVTFLIIAFAAIVAFPYLPGAKSPAFQGVSVFLGLLLSLGSSAAVANVVAGVILIYTRAFEVGDRVKVGDAIGDIVEKTLLVTRIRTIKNVVITIPNASVLNAQIINYSAAAQDPNTPPLILHTTITLGYDVPWRTVHQALIGAAHATPSILPEPTPFVLQTSLDDFYVSYEINAYTNTPKIMAKIYSELHQNIQDKCNEIGIEILSPHYRAVRDGNQNTIPENYLPADYIVPGFRIDRVRNIASSPDPQPKSTED